MGLSFAKVVRVGQDEEGRGPRGEMGGSKAERGGVGAESVFVGTGVLPRGDRK